MTQQPTTAHGADDGAANSRRRLAHELAHGLASMGTTLGLLRRLMRPPIGEIDQRDWERAQRLVSSLDHECQSQLFHCMAILSAVDGTARGYLRPQLTFSSPIDLLADFIAPYAERAARIGIQIILEDVPRNSSSFPKLLLEQHLFRRACHQVLSNAVKYSFSGRGGNRYVQIYSNRATASPTTWEISFENYGIGILPEELPRVFSGGFRGSMAIEVRAFGTGLGLVDARRCMEAHGGQIRIESRHQVDRRYLTTTSLIFPEPTRLARQLLDEGRRTQ